MEIQGESVGSSVEFASPERRLLMDRPRQRNGFYPLDVVDKLEEATMPKVEAYMKIKIAAGKNNGCTLETAGVRREWYV